MASKESGGQSDGPHGPYIQSHRLHIYQDYIKVLLEVIEFVSKIFRNAKLITVSARQID